jgi:lysophospholipase L1-like esterase
MKKYFFPIIVLFLSLNSSAQLIPVDDNEPVNQYPFINTIFNRLLNSSDLDSFYQKLYILKKTRKGVVNIVHIGDSHIQADYLSGLVRNSLQDFFGNAGRGLVFPYQLAQSNAPQDIISFSNVSWQYNRLAHPEIPITAGISGFGIQTNALGASIDLGLRATATGDQSFNRLKFFLDYDTTSFWILQADNDNAPVLVKREKGDTAICREIDLEKNSTRFSLASIPSLNTKVFYGVSLENSAPGILYHTIGVNGIRYDQYNIAPLFWQQLPALNADLFIVSLGTNEAQRAEFDQPSFQQAISLFLKKLKVASPHAAILITTAADSFKDRRPNAVLRDINLSLFNYANSHNIPIWDLYRITNGFGSAYNWQKRGLMNADGIHYTGDGYKIQGRLLFNALARGYNNYVNSY